MEYYAHRGNLHGPQPQLENSPGYLAAAAQAGFRVECDLRFHADRLWLGHDAPLHKVDEDWLYERRDDLLVHAKNAEAVRVLMELGCHHFCHFEDAFALTSRGLLWVHDVWNIMPDRNCIIPLIGADEVTLYAHDTMGGVCSDYIMACKERFKERRCQECNLHHLTFRPS